MKKIILVGDGMGDSPVPGLGDKTPLQAADMPTIRRLAALGEVKVIQTVPESHAPGSDVANMSLLAYNPSEGYTGRAPIEAAGAGIALSANDVAYRCNLVHVDDERMIDYSGGHITTQEAIPLIAAVQNALGIPGRAYHPGVSYRHLLVWENGPADVLATPPHDITDEPLEGNWPTGEGAEELKSMMLASRHVLEAHPVNQRRIAEGKVPANQIWLWGQGRAMQLPSYQERFGLCGGVVSAVDLVRGLGLLAGLKAPHVKGATGFLDTNYEGKVDALFDLLKDGDFGYLHLEAPDECGHLGDAVKKVEAIEAFDRRIVAPVWKKLEEAGEPYRLIITMDHRTPIALKTHSREPVPMIVVDGPVGTTDKEALFDESVIDESVAYPMAYDVIAQLLKKA